MARHLEFPKTPYVRIGEALRIRQSPIHRTDTVLLLITLDAAGKEAVARGICFGGDQGADPHDAGEVREGVVCQQ